MSDAARREAEAFVDGIYGRCHRCEGEGQLWADGQMHTYSPTRPTAPCPNCGGTGRVFEEPNNMAASLAALLDTHAAAQSAALAGRLRGLAEKWRAYDDERLRHTGDSARLVEASSKFRAGICATELAAALQEPPRASENTRELADEIAREQGERREDGA